MGKYADALELFETSVLSSLKPKPDLQVWEWADKYRILPRKTSSESGKWKTERTPYLKEIMDELSYTSTIKKVVMKKGVQLGAALCLETPIPSVKGWETMGSLSVGDEIFDENGMPCRVTFKSDVFTDHRCYRVIFSDKSEIRCDAGHRWSVLDERNYRNVKEETVDTDYLFQNFLNKNKDGSKRSRLSHRFSIPISKKINCKDTDLKIDPYLLGIWLGDGNRHTGIIYLNKADSFEILKKINRKVRVRDDSENCVECLIDGFCKELRLFGQLKKEKSIPQEYLRGSHRQRMNLLKGLMDSDGSISNNRCEYSTVDRKLSETFYELLMSLGIKASTYEVWSKNSVHKARVSKPRKMWRTSFTIYKDNQVFNLKRKKNLIPLTGRISETKKRKIVRVEKIKSVKTQCIQVNSEKHLYLCGKSFIPTHNTECGNNWIGYTIDYDPCTMMVVWPSLPDVKKNSKLRIKPLIENVPQLRDKIGSGNKRDESNTAFFKDFEDGALILTGANSASGLRSVPAKKSFMDEIDAYPIDCEGEGSPIALVEKRSSTFSDRKSFLVSTPTYLGRSQIHKEFLLSDQRWFYVPCPHCNEYQILGHEDHKNPLEIFNYLSYETDTVDIDGEQIEMVKSAAMFCKKCGQEIEEYNKTKMLESGEWRKHNPKSEVAGFMLSSVYSPLGWHSWKDICQNYVKYKNSGDESDLKVFINTDLGEVYEDKGERPAEDKLFNRRESYQMGIAPKGVIFLTCAVDVQGDRLEAEVHGWGRKKERWVIERLIINGCPDFQEVWNDLEEYITQTFHHADGYEMGLLKVVIDSGDRTQTVYNFCKKFDPRRVMPIKGRAELTQILGKPTTVQIKENGNRIRTGMKLWTIGVNILKSELYGDLGKEAPNDGDDFPAGYIHFPMMDKEYFLQLVAEEKKIKKNTKGFNVVEWHKKRERNETLDLFVYNRAAASMVGIDRFREQHWLKLESQINVVKKLQRPENKINTANKEKREKKSRSGFW